jgi:hypothetical protein
LGVDANGGLDATHLSVDASSDGSSSDDWETVLLSCSGRLTFEPTSQLTIDAEGVPFDIVVKDDRALVGVLFGSGGIHSIEVSSEGVLSREAFTPGSRVRDLTLEGNGLYVAADSLSGGGVRLWDVSLVDAMTESAHASAIGPENAQVAVSGLLASTPADAAAADPTHAA